MGNDESGNTVKIAGNPAILVLGICKGFASRSLSENRDFKEEISLRFHNV
jgi:hypothetical protein